MSVDPKAGYKCPTCVGTGSIESSDSTDDSWWDCRVCGGTGRLADRRRSRDPLVDAAREVVDSWREYRSGMWGGTTERQMNQEIDRLGAALGEGDGS